MEQHLPKPSRLTLRYSGLHGCFWAVHCCMFSFAAAFLMSKGYTASQTGVLMALSCLCSCLLQPAFASVADKSGKISLQMLLTCTLAGSFGCMLLLRLSPMSSQIYAAVYLIGALLLDLSIPLINALSVYYTERGLPVNYGIGRGVGSVSFAAASALIGFVMERHGPDAMLSVALILFVLLLILVLGFPRLQRSADLKTGEKRNASASGEAQTPDNLAPPCTLFQFFIRYRWFCISLTGILFMASFHAMTENYMITILKRIGGGSADLGIALAIATVAETPIILFFSKYRKIAKTSTWLIIAAGSFLLKSILLLLARSVLAIMLIQLLQLCSYGLYAPASVLYAREKVNFSDMVKGQAMITAFYALGCSFGNFIGGILLDRFGVDTMLWCGIGFAFVAVLILVISSNKQERIDLHEQKECCL